MADKKCPLLGINKIDKPTEPSVQYLNMKDLTKAMEDEYDSLGWMFSKSTGYEGDIFAHDPELLKRKTEEMVKQSRFYEAPKEDKPYEYDSDWD